MVLIDGERPPARTDVATAKVVDVTGLYRVTTSEEANSTDEETGRVSRLLRIAQNVDDPAKLLAELESRPDPVDLRTQVRLAASLNNLADLYREVGRPEDAIALMDEAVSIYREVGSTEAE
jgi:hypothetical protein